MIRRLAPIALIISALAIPPIAAAEPVTLLAAAGNDWKYALELQPPNGWAVKQFEDLIEIRFPGTAAELTLPTAIRPPVTDVSWEVRDGDLFLRFVVACSCSISVTENKDVGLTLELAERKSVAVVPAPLRAPFPPARTPGVIAASEKLPAETLSGELDVDEARARLMKQLLRAAEAGLIEMESSADAEVSKAEPNKAPVLDGPKPDVDAKTSPVTTGKSDDVAKADSGNDPKAKTESGPKISMPDDRESAGKDGDAAAAAADTPEARCHPADVLTLPFVEGEPAWSKRIGDLRAKLIGEFDEPDASVAVELARVYLGSGLTDEALAVLENFGDGGPVAAVVAELGQVLSERTLVDTASLLRSDCLGPQALWRAVALAKAGDAAGAIAAEEASGRALEKLPPSLRREVAARLGIAAADLGSWDDARRFHAMIRRSEAESTNASGWSDLLAARLAAWSGTEEEVLRALTAARTAGPDVATEATLTLAEHVLSSNQTDRRGIASLITDVGLIARLNRGAPQGVRAADLEVRLTDRLRGRAKAMDLLTLGLALGNFTEAGFTNTLSTLVEGADEAGRNSIASIYLEDRDAFGPALQDVRFRAVLAKSLIELGLPSQAVGLFGQMQVPEEVAVDLADGFLAVGDARAAITIIADLKESPERERLRQAAMGLLGEPVGAEAPASKQKPSSSRLIAMSRAAIAAGDLERALDLTLQRLSGTGDVATAETAALIALAAGNKAIPADVDVVLKEGSPILHARLAALFSNPPSVVDPKNPTTAAAFLKRLDAEIAVMEDILEDG